MSNILEYYKTFEELLNNSLQTNTLTYKPSLETTSALKIIGL